MLKEFSKKVPQGKLVRLKIDFDSKINSIQINGDFFLHPEEAITKIENSLIGSKISESIDFFEQNISNSLKKQNAQFIGLNANDLAQIIKEAIGETK
ncbi:MAG: lipoate protein ligase C-terminal domain-containing protein [archaeon]|nr:lipoate protein ligase C-terminal domain-containing protein [archaeon]